METRKGSIDVDCLDKGEYVPTKSYFPEIDAIEKQVENVTLPIFYNPHSVILLVSVIGLLLYSVVTSDDSSTSTNVWRGVVFVIVSLLAIGTLVFPSGPFTRPHPIIWRLVFGISLAYLLFLVFVFFQTYEDVHRLFNFIDPKSGLERQEFSYAEDCTINYENVMSKMDRYVFGHMVGWAMKALMLRDYVLLWTCSIAWEIIELLFLHMLPNFSECWWDQWILDVLLCNGIGIYIGMQICKFLEVKHYKWSGLLQIDNFTGKIERAVLQFTPESWISVRWEITSSIRRLAFVNFLFICISLADLNAFFLKNVLWLPVDSPLNWLRLLLWFMISIVALRQAYIYITVPTCKRLGTQALLCLGILALELLIVIKFGWERFPEPMPDHVKIMWTIITVCYVFFWVFMLIKIPRKQKEKKQNAKITQTEEFRKTHTHHKKKRH